ncbi:MAG: HepT-like ribonuclease domain-containing protein [Patescibacteria group bacterium]
MEENKVNLIKEYCQENQNVELAFIFGSQPKGLATDESDVDVGVYLKDTKVEDSIWHDLTSLIHEEVDLVVLNDAPATLVSNVFKTGLPLAIKNKKLYWKLYLEKTMEAEDFAEFAQSYWQIYQRSQSLTPEDKSRILERVVFLENELAEVAKFQKASRQDYEGNKPLRREMERWAENIINAQIDIAKIVLACERKEIPKTYEEVLSQFAALAGLDEPAALKLSGFARLRNILAHEYLDILYQKITSFIDQFPPLYIKISAFLKEYLK